MTKGIIYQTSLYIEKGSLQYGIGRTAACSQPVFFLCSDSSSFGSMLMFRSVFHPSTAASLCHRAVLRATRQQPHGTSFNASTTTFLPHYLAHLNSTHPTRGLSFHSSLSPKQSTAPQNAPARNTKMADNNPNGVDDDDEALRIAIALSLGQDPNSAASNAPIDLTGPEDDDECRVVEPTVNARTYGWKEASSAAATASGSSSIVVPAPSQPGVTSSSSLLVGLDRKKMEEERLARAARKRKADDEQVGSVGEGGGRGRPCQRVRIESSAASAASSTSTSSAINPQKKSDSSTGKSSNDELPFPRGVVKRTWCLGQPRTGDDIKIEEVLQKDKLELAVLSSFQWDEEWLMEKVDIDKTKMVLIAFAKDDKQVGLSSPRWSLRGGGGCLC